MGGFFFLRGGGVLTSAVFGTLSQKISILRSPTSVCSCKGKREHSVSASEMACVLCSC
jgi:hypothetical protein